MPLPRRFSDLPPDYRVALEAGAGTSPVRAVVRIDDATRLQVYDVWDMRPRLLRGERPVLLEEGLLSMDDVARVAEDLERGRRTSGALRPPAEVLRVR